LLNHIDKWGAYKSKNGEHLHAGKMGSVILHRIFFFMDIVGLFSDVPHRYSLGANPRGVKESESYLRMNWIIFVVTYACIVAVRIGFY
jgi:hypothetical protein